MSALRRAIASLAEDFASKVLAAIRTASFGEIAALGGGEPQRRGPGRPARAAAAAPAAPRGRRGGRRRRTNADLEALGSRIVDVVKGAAGGMRAEAIRESLGVARKELPRALSQLISSGLLKKEGERRATTYFVGDGSAPRASRGRKKGAKRAGKRRSKKSA